VSVFPGWKKEKTESKPIKAGTVENQSTGVCTAVRMVQCGVGPNHRLIILERVHTRYQKKKKFDSGPYERKRKSIGTNLVSLQVII